MPYLIFLLFNSTIIECKIFWWSYFLDQDIGEELGLNMNNKLKLYDKNTKLQRSSGNSLETCVPGV